MKEKTMTTREVAEALGITTQAVRDRAREIGKVMVERQPAQFTVEEVTAITQLIKSNPSNNLQSSTLQNMPDTVLTPQFKLAKAIRDMQEAYEEIVAQLNAKVAEQQVLLDNSKEWCSVKRMQALNDFAYDWRALKNYSIENGFEIKKVFDQNYGEVNAYHKDVWLAVYGEQCDEVPWNDSKE